MKCKKLVIRFVIPVLIVVAAVLTVLFAQNGKHAKIDEWSSTLVAERVEWAEVAKGYGTGQCSYEISTGEYSELVSLLETVKEESSFRKRPIDAL